LETHHDGTNPDAQSQIKDALLFAQQLADREIASIERIHKRTLVSFGYIGVFVAATIGVFGYIGYSNLQDAAVATARSQMEKEVAAQVREKLTTEKINQIVQDQVRDLSSTILKAEIRKELESPPLSTSIQRKAGEEAQGIIQRQFSPRHFSAAQSKILIEQLTDMKDLSGYTVGVIPAAFNVEAINYASEIKESLSHSKVKVIDQINFDKPPIEGVGIYYDERQPDTYARHLQDALRAAGVTSRLVPGTLQYSTENSAQGAALEVFVGTKPMQ
jgi:hypothetical protein